MAECELTLKEKKLERFFSMKGGDDDSSYARNAKIQAYRLRLLKPVLEEAIGKMMLFPETTIQITDLGCSCGNNTLYVVDNIVNKLKNRYVLEAKLVPEFQVFFSDLPSNDFNSLFHLLYPVVEAQSDKALNGLDGDCRPYFAVGVPGSFYKRLFPRQSLHFVHSSYSLHWLSQIPDEVTNKNSPSYKKGRVYIHNGPIAVAKAYARQFERDFSDFLTARGEEMRPGGFMFLTLCGRTQLDETKQDTTGTYFGEHFESAWNDLISEGLLDEEKRDSFNIPAYSASVDECREIIEKQSPFRVERLDVRKASSFKEDMKEKWLNDPVLFADTMSKDFKSVCAKLIEAHIGEKLSNELFCRLHKHMEKGSRNLIYQLYSELVELVIVLARK